MGDIGMDGRIIFVRETGREGKDFIYLAQDRVQRRVVMNIIVSFRGPQKDFLTS
jgi:hypothetical protein